MRTLWPTLLTLTVLSLLPSAAFADYQAEVLADQPWGYWPLEEPHGSATLSDASGNGHDGQLSGGSWSGVERIRGPITSQSDFSWKFGAGHNLKVTNAPTSAASFSLEMWVRLDNQNIGPGSCVGYFAAVEPVQGTVGMRLSTYGNSDPAQRYRLITEYTPFNSTSPGRIFEDGRAWHHIVVTRDVENDVVSYYVDGQLSHSVATTNNDPVLRPDLLFGNYNCPATGISLDDPAVYTQALSASRVAAHYAAANAIDTAIEGPSSTASPEVTFTLSSNQPDATYECRLDAGAWQACTSPKTYSELPGGRHKLEVRALNAENMDPVPATRVFTVDGPYSAGVLASDPWGYWRLEDPFGATTMFDLSGNGHNGGLNGSWGTSPTRIPGPITSQSNVGWRLSTRSGFVVSGAPSSVKDFTVQFWARQDNHGNSFGCIGLFNAVTSGGTKLMVMSIYVASSNPSLRNRIVTEYTPDFNNTSAPVFADGGWHQVTLTRDTQNNEVKYYFDGVLSSTITSTSDAALLGDQLYFGDYSCSDAGVSIDEAAVYTRVLAPGEVQAVYNGAADATAPDTTITSAPADRVGSPNVEFEFTSNESYVTFECRLDTGSWAGCSSPNQYAGLGDGSHTFDVRARDTAGNIDSTPASRTFTVDTTAPDTAIESGPTGVTGDSTPTFTFSASEAGTFECRVDAGTWGSCSSPHELGALTDGEHTLEVRAVDTVGNTDATPASRSFTVDASAPDTTIESGPASRTNDASPTLTFSASESATFECRVDGGAWSSCTSPQELAVLQDGAHTFDVRATDAAGNVDATPASRSFIVDTASPDTVIDSGPQGPTNDTTPTYAFSASEDATFECRVDGGGWGSCSSPHDVSALSEEVHTFEVRATDLAGNIDPTPATRTVTVDTTPPNTTITSAPTVGVLGSATFEFTATEGGTFECRMDSGAWTACTSPKSYTGLSFGQHVFEVRAIDAAGNVDPTPARHEFISA